MPFFLHTKPHDNVVQKPAMDAAPQPPTTNKTATLYTYMYVYAPCLSYGNPHLEEVGLNSTFIGLTFLGRSPICFDQHCQAML